MTRLTRPRLIATDTAALILLAILTAGYLTIDTALDRHIHQGRRP